MDTHGPMVHHVIFVNYNLSGACHAYMLCLLPTHPWGLMGWLTPTGNCCWSLFKIHWMPWRFEDPPPNLSKMTFMNFEWSKRGTQVDSRRSGIDSDPWPQWNTANNCSMIGRNGGNFSPMHFMSSKRSSPSHRSEELWCPSMKSLSHDMIHWYIVSQWMGWFSTHFPRFWVLGHHKSPSSKTPGNLPFWRSLALSTVTVSCCTSWVSNLHWHVVEHIYKKQRYHWHTHIFTSSNIPLYWNKMKLESTEPRPKHTSKPRFSKSKSVSLNPSSNRKLKTFHLHSNPSRTWRSCPGRTWSTPAMIHPNQGESRVDAGVPVIPQKLVV